jgi:aspartate dehydrogenase
MQRMTRLASIGWGAINSRVGALLRQRETPVEIVAIAAIDTPEARAQLPRGVPFLGSTEALAALKPDLVIEAVGRAAIAQWAPAALAMIIASTSAFSDDALLVWLVELAEGNGSRIEIPPGAIGGIDALASAAVGGTGILRHSVPDFTFFHRIRRAKPSAFGHVGCVQWSCSFRTGTDDEILRSAERSGHPLARFARC